jgi:PAS domain S-box-containing protein
MYAHFLSFPETRAFFPNDETLQRAQVAQKRYFLRLTKGNYDRDYVAERLAVGDTHYRIGLEPTWYLGAYNRVMDWVRKLVSERYPADSDKFLAIISALTRLVFFDMGLAIEAYSIAKERAIREQRDAIAQLETERRVTKAILEDAPVGIVRFDSDFVITECNPEFLEILKGREHSDTIGQPLFTVAPHLNKHHFKQLLESGQSVNVVGDLLNFAPYTEVAPTFFDWAVWAVRGQPGISDGFVAMFTDVTSRMLLQQQREDFVATLTHDLKTPILAANRAIKCFIEGDFGPVPETQITVLETIHQSNDSLYRLVQTLLDVYRYDSGAKKLTVTQCDLSAMIQRLVSELQPLAESRGVTVEAVLPKADKPIPCDADEIRRVLQNLVDNALKFTPSGGQIKISMKEADRKRRISVQDSGKGIPEEDKPKLFQRFWAAAASGRYYASTGLGLYLCRKIVELHGGRIWCESTLGVGSTFHFTIDPESAQHHHQPEPDDEE